MKIGVSSYSFQQYLNDGRLDVIGTVAKAKEIGFDAIEFVDFNLKVEKFEEKKALAEKLVEECKKYDIEISAYVGGANLFKEGDELKAEMDRVKTEIDIANTLGVKLYRFDITYGALPMGLSFEMVLNKVVDSIRELADYANTYGIMTMIENHGLAFQDAYRVEQTVNLVNRDNFRLLVDVGNFICADEDPVKSVSRVATLAAHVHFKDMKLADYYSDELKEGCFVTRGMNRAVGVPVGYGDVKAAQSLAILIKAGYRGYLDIEYEGCEDCVEGIKKGYEFLKNELKKYDI
ncbi:MAG: sugar phosphate isomerase/epimerase [Clostridia bacterium]|nr:sugar phosphate isomerase/epimerase [Clostridia bacterium]